jgi:4-hydroxy-3-methylbut-2-en-1-yl diphosphate reductase
VAGRASSNGKVLYDVAKQANPNTFFIEDVTEIDPAWLSGASNVGISGATSTPHWYMEQVRDVVTSMMS